MAACRRGRGRRAASAAALVLGLMLLPLSGARAQSGGEGVQFDPQNPKSPAYREAIGADDAARKRRAEEEGESFSPTFDRPTRPVEPAVRVGPPPAEIPAAPAAGVERPPAIAEPPPETRPVRGEPVERATPPAAQYRESLPDRRGQPDRGGDASPIDALLEVLNQPAGKAAWLEYTRETAAEGSRAGPGQAAPVLPPALARLAVGRGLYARTLYEANSDWPGPVVLELLEPPLAGAVATGAFQETNERLVIRIDRLALGGRSWAVEGWAVDPGCACYGIAGEVDRHWFQRVLLPSALAFAEGFLDAAAQTARVVSRDASGNSIAVESAAPTHRQQVHAGAANAARLASRVLLESAPDGPTVRVPVDTELVLVVTAPPEPERRTDGPGRAPGGARGAAPTGRQPPVAVIEGARGAVIAPEPPRRGGGQ